ncbi:hypothetical protein EDB86DRAFT_824793 [Lactarius hatsudake]|nr:hypothetical protein EDB86DRAFT_824793 [Lactarius hatsudake]
MPFLLLCHLTQWQANGIPNAMQNNAITAYFPHPEGTASRDAYFCRKCTDDGLAVYVTPCPSCLDPYPWLPRK